MIPLHICGQHSILHNTFNTTSKQSTCYKIPTFKQNPNPDLGGKSPVSVVWGVYIYLQIVNLYTRASTPVCVIHYSFIYILNRLMLFVT